MLIRNERFDDALTISQIQYAAFTGHPMHAPGAEPLEHRIVEALREAGALSLSLLAEADGEAVAHVALSPAVVGQDPDGWFLLGPIGVLPRLQGQGLGSALVRQALQRMRAQGAAGVVLVGDPAFYSRLSFSTVPGLVYPGVPDQYVLAVSFGQALPNGAISAHAAFNAAAHPETANADASPANDGPAHPLRRLGFDPWHEAHGAGPDLEDCGLARVCTVDRGAYLIKDAEGDASAELSGKLAYNVGNPTELPCVGDWVAVQHYNKGSAAIIHQVLPRKSFLRRRTPGDPLSYQMIATNIDTAFLVQSCHFDFNPKRLERYLVMALDGLVEPVILLTKTDLISPEELEQKRALVRAVTSARVIALSTGSEDGFAELQQTLRPGKTYCLLGSSGVGKTTLINRLLGHEAFATQPVSNTGEGTHTTTRRQLIVLAQGAMVIDTPGMRELGIAPVSEGIDLGFDDVQELAAGCRYADCGHQQEPDCAVRAAVENGSLQQERYAHYLKLKKEAAFREMSALEKRKKDRTFGRLVKTVKKRPKG